MAYDFNGTNQSMQTASTPVNTPPFTFACWFNVDTLTSANGAVLLGISHPAGFSRYLMSMGQAPSPLYAFQTNASNVGAFVISTTNVSTATWSHGAAVFASNTERSVFLNGGNNATNTTNNAPTNANITRIGIGAQFFNSTTNSPTDGKIAEVGIWNAALTAAEIASLAKGMTCDKVRPQSLIFYAPLVRDLIDQKGGLTITNNNGATVANHPRVYA